MEGNSEERRHENGDDLGLIACRKTGQGIDRPKKGEGCERHGGENWA